MKYINRILIVSGIIALVSFIAIIATGSYVATDVMSFASTNARGKGDTIVDKSTKAINDNYKIEVDGKSIEVDVNKYDGNEVKYKLIARNKKTSLEDIEESNGLKLNVIQTNKVLGVKADKLEISIPTNKKVNLDIDINAGEIEIDEVILNSLNVKNNAGEIKIEDSRVSDLDVVDNAGNIILKEIEITNKLNVKNDAGETRIEDIIASEVSAKANAGNIVLKNNRITNILNVRNDAGQIELKDMKDLKVLEVKTSLGNTDIKDVYAKSVKVTSNLGNVDYNNEDKSYKFDKFDVNVDVGSKNIKVN